MTNKARLSAKWQNGMDVELDGVYYRLVYERVSIRDGIKGIVHVSTLVNDQWDYEAQVPDIIRDIAYGDFSLVDGLDGNH